MERECGSVVEDLVGLKNIKCFNNVLMLYIMCIEQSMCLYKTILEGSKSCD